MMENRGRAVGAYFLRLIGGVAVIIGILGVFSSLANGNLFGVGLSIAFVVGGAVMLKRSGEMTTVSAPR
jgi:hypothetical protein